MFLISFFRFASSFFWNFFQEISVRNFLLKLILFFFFQYFFQFPKLEDAHCALGLRAWLFPLLVGAEMLAGVVQEHGDSGVIKVTLCHTMSHLALPFPYV